jgi:hypothetical protein
LCPNVWANALRTSFSYDALPATWSPEPTTNYR